MNLLTRLKCALWMLALLTACPVPAEAAEISNLTNLVDQFTSTSNSTGDAKLKALADELSSKIEKLNQSTEKDTATKDQLSSALQALVGGKSVEALATFNKLSKAKLTPAQTRLAKETWNLGSAYVVHKDLGALEGAQGDVAEIVKALRVGEAAKALPAIQKVAKEATLTAGQKQLLTSLAEQYAPGIGKLGESLDGLKKNIPGLGK